MVAYIAYLYCISVNKPGKSMVFHNKFNDPDGEKDVIGKMVCDSLNEKEVSKYSLTHEWSTCIESTQKCNIM